MKASRSSARSLLYKYKSLQNWRFILDILLNGRLYAATFKELNDPMEGRLYYFEDTVSRAFRSSVDKRQAGWRICSLTRDARNTLMWSYYADGHTGVVFGFERPTSKVYRLHEVTYDRQVWIDGRESKQPADAVALTILRRKLDAWGHEAEWRIFTRKMYVPIRLSEVHVGCRTSDGDRELLRTLLDKTNPRPHLIEVKEKELDAPVDTFAPRDRSA